MISKWMIIIIKQMSSEYTEYVQYPRIYTVMKLNTEMKAINQLVHSELE